MVVRKTCAVVYRLDARALTTLVRLVSQISSLILSRVYACPRQDHSIMTSSLKRDPKGRPADSHAKLMSCGRPQVALLLLLHVCE